ncbi:hypothetical protein HDU91_004783 [Kappamyces sp. JEL0680]|nr:hypothetical protein HDU91_004783 [Kappamyces sp. JEL0680]
MQNQAPFPREIQAGDGRILVAQLKETHLGPALNVMTRKRKRMLQHALASQGYLLLRNFLPPELVQAAFHQVAGLLQDQGFVGKDECDRIPETLQSAGPAGIQTIQSPGMMARQDWIRANPTIMQVLEHERLLHLTEILLSSSAAPSQIVPVPFKWLRAVGTGLFTGLHKDDVYVGGISPHQLTVWIPFSPIPTSKGSLVVAPESHRSPRWQRVHGLYDHPKAGAQGDGTTAGWLTRDPCDIMPLLDPPCGGDADDVVFCSADFLPGDVVVLDLNTIHMTAMNTLDVWRISCDTRWIRVG